MKLAFASCAKLQSTNPQPVWSEIRAEKPDVVLLLGDNVYLDHDRHDNAAELSAELDARYQAQLAEEHFAALLRDVRSRGGEVLAIYDDHDFLGNNRYGGDHGPSLRDAARKALIRAFAPQQTGSDVYRVHRAGPVDIVVLDERFYRRSPAASGADRNAILGQEQWDWLENVVTTSDAPYLLVASSTTLHSFADESWEQYPGAFTRLVDLLRRHKNSGKAPLVVSGDVHRNTVYDDSGVIEIVSSAVARHGIVFGSPRRNYGILNFDDDRLRVQLRSLKVGWRFDFVIQRGQWSLP
jgi:alkaline phosphatase D